MRLSWHDLGTSRADRASGKKVEITGWPTTALPVRARFNAAETDKILGGNYRRVFDASLG